jgi:hypothetical protein
VKIEINIGSIKLLIALAVLLMPSVIGLVLGYGTTHPSSFDHSWGEMECSGRVTSENAQDRSMTKQDISQSFPGRLTVSGGLGLGASVPTSTTCSDQIYTGGKSQKTPPNRATLVLVPRDVVVHNNKIAVQYVLDTECSAICDGTNFHYERYYYGNNQWSNCFGKIQSCSPPCSSLR